MAYERAQDSLLPYNSPAALAVGYGREIDGSGIKPGTLPCSKKHLFRAFKEEKITSTVHAAGDFCSCELMCARSNTHFTCARFHPHTRTPTQTRISQTHARAHIHTHTHTLKHTHTNTHTQTHTHTHTHTHTREKCIAV